MGKAAEDNPDLPFSFIKDTLTGEGDKTILQALTRPGA